MADIDELSAHFVTLNLPAPARAWLLDLWTVIQVLDDAADGHKSPDAGRAAMGYRILDRERAAVFPRTFRSVEVQSTKD